MIYRPFYYPFYVFILFIYFSSNLTTAQFNGTIKDTNNIAVPNVTVILYKSLDSTMASFTHSDSKGFYSILPKEKGNHYITYSSLGYSTETKEYFVSDINLKTIINVVLNDQQIILEEVIIKANPPIRIKKDTVIIDAKAFMQGNEQVVEDLLKKIPGVMVDADGTIRIGNQEVEKVMIEGDDFFERGYKLLTKNMPAKPLNKIEILQRYSNNKYLRGVEESNKVALNLTLDEDAKRQWFGNIELGQDLQGDSFYQAKFNLMNVSKKNKYFFLGNANSIGKDATGEINDLIQPYRQNEPGRIGDNAKLKDILSLENSLFNFDASRSNFNNAELLSLNAIFNPDKKLKTKTLLFLNWDEKEYFRNSASRFFAETTNFTNTEDYKLSNNYKTGFGKVQLNYEFSEKTGIESTTSFSDRGNDVKSNLLFNGVSTIESLSAVKERLDHETTYTNKLDDTNALLVSARLIKEKAPQQYNVNRFFFEDLFSSDPVPESVSQDLQSHMKYMGINIHYLARNSKSNLLELQLGSEYREDILENVIQFQENGNFSSPPAGYQNNTRYQVNDLYFKGKYIYNWKAFKLVSELSLHQLFNSLEQSTSKHHDEPFFLNGKVSINYKVNRKNTIAIGATQNTKNAEISNVYDQYILTGYRSFKRGTGTFNQLESSIYNFHYRLGNWSDNFFATLYTRYKLNYDFFSTNSIIQSDFSQTEQIIIKDQEFFIANVNLDFYVPKLTSNVKLKGGYVATEFSNIINNSNLRLVKSKNYSLGLEMRSAFSGIFNYHAGTSWRFNEVASSGISKSFIDNKSFIDLSLIFNEEFNLQFKTERYFFGNINDGDNTYYFMDLNVRCNFKKSPFSLSLTSRNMTNTQEFRTSTINDISSSTVSYRLLPRYLLLNVKYRF